MYRGRTCEQIMTDLRTGAIDRKSTEGQKAVYHLLKEAAKILQRRIFQQRSEEQRAEMYYEMHISMLRSINNPTQPDAIALEKNFQSRVINFRSRIFTTLNERWGKDVMTCRSDAEIDMENVSDGIDLVYCLNTSLDQRRQAEEGAQLGEPAASIIRLHDEGLSNTAIAATLKVSEGTVRYHLRKHRGDAGRRRTK